MRIPSRIVAENLKQRIISDRPRRSEAGDTLIEVLLAIVVLGLASVAILLAFATSISGSAEHRTLTTADTVLRTAAEESISQIQQQSSTQWGQCPASPYSWLPSSITPLPNGYSEQVTGVSYWNGSTFVPSTSSGACTVSSATSPQINSPLLVTITVKSASGVISSPLSFVVDDPFARPIPTAGTATQLVFIAAPTSTTSMVSIPFSFQPIVAVEDANGNIVTKAFASVTLSIGTGPNGGALSNCTATQFKGVVTYAGCSVNQVGTYTLSASESGLTSATSAAFTVGPAPASMFVISSNPTSGMASTTATIGPITVQEQDPFGNLTTAAQTVNLSSDSTGTTVFSATPGGTAISSITIPAGSSSASFYYGDTRSGTPTITSSGSLTSDTQTETVTGALATHLVFTSSPSSTATGGTAFGTQPVVTAEDVFGNASTFDSSTVTLAITAGTGTSGASLSGCVASETFGVFALTGCSIDKIGAGYTIRATDGSLTPATSSTITVSLGSASKLAFTTQPVGGVGEATNFATQPKVTVQDAGGNTETTDSGNVTLGIGSYSTANSGSTQGTLSCTSTTVSAVAGVATFANCKISGTAAAGTYALSATRSGLSSGISSSVSIVAGTPTKLVATTQPANTVAGTNFTTAISVEDSLGNVVTSSSAQISLAIGTNAGAGTLSCTTNPINASSGVSTFSCSINKTGVGYTLTATSTGLSLVTSSTFNITPGTPTTLAITTQPPANSTAGTKFTTGVSVEDALGNVVTSSSAPITLAIASNPNLGTLSCTTNPLNASSGVASFSCSIDMAGAGYTLKATSGILTPATTNAIANLAGAGTQLKITSNAINTTASSAATSAFTVTLEDTFGNPTTKGTAITVNLTSTSSGKKFAASSNGASTPTVTLLANTTSVTAFYGDSRSGSPTITASVTGGSPTSDTQTESVT